MKTVEDALRHRTQELECLFKIASVLVQPGEFEEKATRILEELVQVSGADWVTFRRQDQDGQGLRLVAVAGPASLESPPIPLLSASETLAFDVIRQGEAIVANDYAAHPNASPGILELGMNSMVLMPVKAGNQSIGLVNVISRESDHFTPDLVKVLLAITDGLGALLENAQLGWHLKAGEEEMSVVDEMAKIITSTLDIEQVYEQFAGEVKKIVYFDRISIFIIDEHAGTITVNYCSGIGLLGSEVGSEFRLRDTRFRELVATGKGSVVNDFAASPEFSPDQRYLEAGLTSGLFVPLVSNARIVGVFSLSSRKANAFGKREQRIAERLAKQIAPAIENARLYDQVVSELGHRELIEEALRYSESRFRQISENMREVVFLVDHIDYKVLYVNNAYQEIWDQPCKDLYDNPKIWLDAVHPDDRPRVEAALNNQQSSGEFEEEFRIVRPDGEIRWIFDRIFPIQNEAGQVYRLVGIAEDITKRKRTEQQMYETARLASIGELAAGVAHEVNNPLTVVLGFSQLVLGQDLSSSTRRDVVRIYEHAQRASKVMEHLLAFARKHGAERRNIDVTVPIADAVQLKAHEFAISNVQVTLEPSPDLPHIMADQHQLQQVFLNIIANAGEVMAEEHGGGNLHISAVQTGAKLRLSFADDGPGILGEQLPKIFNPFFTTKQAGKGTGLGLSISYGIILEHGGAIWAESQPGQGATIIIELPIELPEGEAQPATQDAAPKSLSDQNILVVDDEPGVRDLLYRGLSGLGRTVTAASDGKEAWDLIQENHYDCIIVDLRMPGIGGQELYQLVTDFDPDIARRIIHLTGDTARVGAREFVEATGNFMISKPFELEELFRRVQDIFVTTAR